MNTKKWLAVGTCVSVMGMFSACSDDESSPITPPAPGPTSSAVVAPGSSDAVPPPGSSAANPTPSSVVAPTSSAAGPAPVSSSDMDAPTDSSTAQMGVSEIMYNAANGSALEWIEVYINESVPASSFVSDLFVE